MNKLAILAVAATLVASTSWAAPASSSAAVEANKKLVADFYTKVLFDRNVDLAATYLRVDYIQHNPKVPTGLKGFQDYFREQFKHPPMLSNRKVEILHTVGDGDLVVLHLHASGTLGNGKPIDTTWFDLFRVQGGKIAEHWDAISAE